MLSRSGPRALAILPIAVNLLVSCSKPEPPTVSPRAVRITAASVAGLAIAADLDVHNPNSFPLMVKSADGRLELGNGTELGRGHADLQRSIPAQGTSPVTAQLNVGWTNLAALSAFALSDQPVPYAFVGTAAVGGERLNVDVPFRLTGELNRQQLMQIGLAGLQQPARP